MEEQEIIKKANELLTRVMSGYGLAKVDKIHVVLQGLLDLYNKEKEKNKKQEKQIEKLLNIKLYACDENKNKECNKKHCYINGGECDRTTDITKVKYINLDEFISKDKIKEKIEAIKTNKLRYFHIAPENWAINILQSLLEKE